MAKKKKTNPRRRPVSVADLNRAKKEALDLAAVLAIGIAAMSAHDAFGFGPARIETLVINMLAKYGDFEDGFFSPEDAREWLKDYAGIDIEER